MFNCIILMYSIMMSLGILIGLGELYIMLKKGKCRECVLYSFMLVLFIILALSLILGIKFVSPAVIIENIVKYVLGMK